MTGPLDLSGGDLSAFSPIPNGIYRVRIQEAEMQETQGGPEAKLPAGTPKLNVQFVVAEGEYEGRYLFGNYVIPPADYDEKKRKFMLGSLANFLIASGYEEKQVMSGKFNPDVNDMAGRELNVVVGLSKDKTNNVVKGAKPLGATVSGGLI